MSDYSIGTSLVYGAFSWSRARTARATFTALAAKHGVAVALVATTDLSCGRDGDSPAGRVPLRLDAVR
jgi:hypothetical protein